MNLYVHPDLEEADRGELDECRWRIEESIAKETPWVKSLSGPYGDTLRVKVGKRRRALFSWGVDDKEQPSIWLHELGWRREIYDRNVGIVRPEAWERAYAARSTSHLGYTLVPRSARTEAPGGSTQLRPVLSADQAAFVRLVLPIEDEERSDLTFVRRADGPPGSGKTIAATECASDGLKDGPNAALENPGCDVVVLAPSSSLVHYYREALRDDALAQARPFAEAQTTGEAELWVEQFDEFFDAFGAPRTPFDVLLRWWTEVALKLPALQQWARRHPAVKGARFLALLDACFGDGVPDGAGEPIGAADAGTGPRVGGGAKDALALHDSALFAALGSLSRGERAAIEASRRSSGIRFRWECAREAVGALARARPGRTVLFVIDEAQDLIPAQWRALILAAFQRNQQRLASPEGEEAPPAGGLTVVALLGDENQRVAPTAFAWTTLDEFVASLHPDLAGGAGVASRPLEGSFRIKQTVAAVANPLVDGSLGTDRARRSRVAGADEVEPGGRVVVVRTHTPDDDLRAAGSAMAARLAPDDRVVCIGARVPRESGLDPMDVREAKGLEYPSLVVAHALEAGLDWDTRSRAYVALTRARDQLLILVTDAEWELVRAHWNGHVETMSAASLAKLIEEDFVLRAGQGDLGTEQLKRIGNLLDLAEQQNSDVPTEVLERAGRLVLGGTPEVLVGYLAGGSARRDAWRGTVLRNAADPTQPIAERIAGWLLAGDVGGALRCARMGAAPAHVVQELERMAEEDGALASASLALRAGPTDIPDGDLVHLVLERLTQQVRELGRPGAFDNDVTAVPRHDLGNKRRSDYLARAVLAAVDAHAEDIIAEATSFAAKLADGSAASRSRYALRLQARRPASLLAAELKTLEDIVQRAAQETKS